MSNALATMKAFENALEKREGKFRTILPAGIDPVRFRAMVINQVVRNPALAECDVQSFVMAAYTIAEVGLEPVLGHVALIPYKGVVTAQFMYQGLLELARRSGQISRIYAVVVYEGDRFEYCYGLKPDIIHVPGDRKSDKWSHVYAVAHMKDGAVQFDVMTYDEVMAIKKRSAAVKSKRSTPWDTDEPEMGKKTVLKRLLKMCPKSVDMIRALDLDGLSEAGKVQAPVSIDIGADDLQGIAGNQEIGGEDLQPWSDEANTDGDGGKLL